jgi:alkylation response protein AidB-like acyl-CoA dehydrogenase
MEGDVAGMRTTAVRKGDKYVINGSKHLLRMVFMRTIILLPPKQNRGNKGISIF